MYIYFDFNIGICSQNVLFSFSSREFSTFENKVPFRSNSALQRAKGLPKIKLLTVTMTSVLNSTPSLSLSVTHCHVCSYTKPLQL